MLTYLTFWASRNSFNFRTGILRSFPNGLSILVASFSAFPRVRLYQSGAFAGEPKLVIVKAGAAHYILRVHRLTKQEQLVLCLVMGLLLVGWAVRAWRIAHPRATPTAQMNSE
jgi:hypothetical protein